MQGKLRHSIQFSIYMVWIIPDASKFHLLWLMKTWFYIIGTLVIALAGISPYVLGIAVLSILLFIVGAVLIYLSNKPIWLKLATIVAVPFISSWLLILIFWML